MKKITVFTPTYNRAHTLKKLYDSIVTQEYSDLEWVIVDDGSSDNTRELINEFINENKINIKYFFQENSGKHIAINRGVEEAEGELFYIVDSDDYLTKDALQIINKWVNTIPEDGYAGVAGLKAFENGNAIGTTFDDSNEFVDATSLERDKYNIVGDKAEVFYTHVLKKYKFPHIEGEKFMTETFLWNKIARDGFKIRWFNEATMICEYREDGLTKNITEVYSKSPKGLLLFLQESIQYETNFVKRLKQKVCYVEVGYKIYTKKEIKENLKINSFEYYILLVASKLKYLIKKFKNK